MVAEPGVAGGDDETVPAVAATPIEYSDDEAIEYRLWQPQPHLPLASSYSVVKYLSQFEQAGLASVRGGDGPDRPWIGFDVDEVIAAGEPSTIGIRLWGAEDSERVVATVKVGETPLAVHRDGSGWPADVPGLAPGAYQIRAGLNHVGQVDRVRGVDALGVIEA